MTRYSDLENTPPPCDGERAGTVNPTTKEIVAAYLKASGYDGLYNTTGDCGCELADLFACGGNDCDCQAGYKVPCDGETCPAFGDCAWHIAAERKGDGRAYFVKAQTAYDTRIAAPDTSERDFRRALFVTMSWQGLSWGKLTKLVNEGADLFLADEQLRRERGGK